MPPKGSSGYWSVLLGHFLQLGVRVLVRLSIMARFMVRFSFPVGIRVIKLDIILATMT